eukprot:Hpha_TRINITY_DN2331_c0_g1::TRINITY_DN2331_c0_g1_i1::g.482::m.482
MGDGDQRAQRRITPAPVCGGHVRLCSASRPTVLKLPCLFLPGPNGPKNVQLPAGEPPGDEWPGASLPHPGWPLRGTRRGGTMKAGSFTLGRASRPSVLPPSPSMAGYFGRTL